MATYRRRLPATSSTIPTRALLACGAALIGTSVWLVLGGSQRVAGLTVGLAGAAGIVGGRFAIWNDDALSRLFDPLLDRVLDGAVLGAIAWAEHEARPAEAVGALVALGASYLSSYVRARAASLGYDVQESTVTRGARYALIAVGLGFGWLGWSLWAAAALAVLASMIRSIQVAKEELV
jgi:CDP-diacylglycerol--glycerol-3-phosphate 3-phosphatidyltransferase